MSRDRRGKVAVFRSFFYHRLIRQATRDVSNVVRPMRYARSPAMILQYELCATELCHQAIASCGIRNEHFCLPFRIVL